MNLNPHVGREGQRLIKQSVESAQDEQDPALPMRGKPIGWPRRIAGPRIEYRTVSGTAIRYGTGGGYLGAIACKSTVSKY